MNDLTPLDEIRVPEPREDELYATTLFDQSFEFHGLKTLLGAADLAKSGDRVAGLAAADELTREAARAILSSLTLQHIYDRPLTDRNHQVDTVMRVNYQVDLRTFQSLSSLTLGELKDKLLGSSGRAIEQIGAAMTGVMAAAIAKLLDVHELIFLSSKISRPTRARTAIGSPGTLSSRLQPNHPTDDLRAITLLTYAGLSMGSGDCLLGVNPAEDTVENTSRILRHLNQLRSELEVPTQICVLSHLKTQLACLDNGDPVEIMFQSLAGTDSTLVEEFDVTVDLLDDAYRCMLQKGPLRKIAENFMYFETGQGSEVSYGKHNGIDMTTCEALCYGLARRYRPFMVNNVTGFIGPETHADNFQMIVANLQDHFMGKFLGLPMGMAPCYTLHSEISIEGHQIATQLLTAAGSNYFMDVYLTADRMLAYFDTSGHDDQTLREVHRRKPAADFLDWAIGKGIFALDGDGNVVRGPNWGDPMMFCESSSEFQRLSEIVPALYGFDNAGPRPANRVSRLFKANQATARGAIYANLRPAELGAEELRELGTAARSKDAHLNNPELGGRFSEQSLAQLRPENKDVQIVISDGLSAEAIHHNVPDVLPVIVDGLQSQNLTWGRHILAPFGRVKLAEAVGKALGTKLVIMLIGERPGGDAVASRSMSAYLAYRLTDPGTQSEAASFSGNPNIRYEYTVISNIYAAGLPPIEAGSIVVEKAIAILTHKAAGNRLESILGQSKDRD